MSDSVNGVSLPRLNISSLFDEPRKKKEVSQNTDKPQDQFKFTVESSMEGFYKNPNPKVNQRDSKTARPELRSENWFG